MNATEQIPSGWPRRLFRVLKDVRLVLIVAALALAVLSGTGVIGLMPALVNYALIVAAALIGRGGIEAARLDRSGDNVSALRFGDPLVEAILAGVPDPVIAVNSRGDVIAFNAHAAAMAPAVRRRQPLAFGLRNQEVIEALRHATASGMVQLVEFLDRVPVGRSHEAIVTPIKLPSGRPQQRKSCCC